MEQVLTWIHSNCKFAQTQTNMIGYRVMRYDNGTLISGADSRQTFSPTIGQVIRFRGNGIYLSLSQQYVLTYYSGLHDQEALVTMEFNPQDVTAGSLEDQETEISVSQAKLVAVEPLPPQ